MWDWSTSSKQRKYWAVGKYFPILWKLCLNENVPCSLKVYCPVWKVILLCKYYLCYMIKKENAQKKVIYLYFYNDISTFKVISIPQFRNLSVSNYLAETDICSLLENWLEISNFRLCFLQIVNAANISKRCNLNKFQ